MKPSTLPRWAETTGGVPASNIVVPPSGELDVGYPLAVGGVGAVPASGKLNWFMHLVYQWLAWLNGLLDQANTWTALQTFSAGLTASGPITLPSNSIPRAALPAVGQQISSSCGTFSTTSASAVDITNLSATITTTGRPVRIFAIMAGTGFSAYGFKSNTNPMKITLLVDGSPIAEWGPDSAAVSYMPSLVEHLDTPVAGTHTYKLQANILVSGTVFVNNIKLVAYEI